MHVKEDLITSHECANELEFRSENEALDLELRYGVHNCSCT